MEKLKLALIGSEQLSAVVANAWSDGLLPEYELIAVLGRSEDRTKEFAQKYGIQACMTIDELVDLQPDYIAEAASVSSVIAYSEMILNAGINFVPLSIGAYADTSFIEHLAQVAKNKGVRIYIPSGAVGGFDVLRTATLMSDVKVNIDGLRSPRVIAKTDLGFDGILDIQEPVRVFSGTTQEAIKVLPTQVNVSVATGLASAGPEHTILNIDVLPGYEGDEHRVTLDGDEVRLDMRFTSKTSTMAGWSLVATLQNIVSPIVF